MQDTLESPQLTAAFASYRKPTTHPVKGQTCWVWLGEKVPVEIVYARPTEHTGSHLVYTNGQNSTRMLPARTLFFASPVDCWIWKVKQAQEMQKLANQHLAAQTDCLTAVITGNFDCVSDRLPGWHFHLHSEPEVATTDSTGNGHLYSDAEKTLLDYESC